MYVYMFVCIYNIGRTHIVDIDTGQIIDEYIINA